MSFAQAHYPDLNNRVALVTGASSGIGLGIAEALLAQGMRVGVHYRSGRDAAFALCERYPNHALPLQADLATEAGCVSLVRSLVDHFGAAHVLVHSAGIWNDGAIETITAARIEEMFRTNTFSAFYLVRELVPAMRSSGKGSLVFIGSTAGQRGEAGHGHYAASKGALQSLVMSLAVELSPTIRTNLVSPGWVRTPMAEATLERVGARLAATIPNRRVAEIADVTAAVLYLASQSSSHLLGQDLCVSGGALLVVPRGQ